MVRWIACGMLAAVAGGCGGQYILTVPDQVAPAGGETACVVRLQRNDFFVLSLAVKKAALRFQAGGGSERGAYTDELGYAGAAVPVPAAEGRYAMRVSHMDSEGEEIVVEAPAYVWPAEASVVVVDLDFLPHHKGRVAEQTVAALGQLAQGNRILYFTRQSVRRHAALHKKLGELGYPHGPILLWQREHWHIVREGKYRIPRMVVESRLVSQLASLKRQFPTLRAGVCGTELAARAFAAEGLNVVVVGSEKVTLPTSSGNPPVLIRRASWAELEKKGLDH